VVLRDVTKLSNAGAISGERGIVIRNSTGNSNVSISNTGAGSIVGAISGIESLSVRLIMIAFDFKLLRVAA
jgi:hypothetical protein